MDSVLAIAKDAIQRSPAPLLAPSLTPSSGNALLDQLREMADTYPAIDSHPYEALPLQSFASPDEHAAFSRHLEAFRRALSTTQSSTGRLLHRWRAKLRQDIERIVVQETSPSALPSVSNMSACPSLIPPSCIFQPKEALSSPSSAVVAIDTTRLPAPRAIAAFESVLVRRVALDIMVETMDNDESQRLRQILRIAVHHAVFATIEPLVSAYENTAMYAHFCHMHLLDECDRPMLPPLLSNCSKSNDEHSTVERIPRTLEALTCMCAETTPLGILSMMMVAIRSLHDEVAPCIPTINADVLIPLLLHVLWMQLDVLPTIYRRLHAAATFSSTYVHDGAEVGTSLFTVPRTLFQRVAAVYYLTCIQAALSHIYASTVGTCRRCSSSQEGTIMWRDLGATDDTTGTNQDVAARSDKEAIAALSAWLKQHTVSDSTISIVSNESWML
ncbi:hypothetical protein DYB32_010290 [Aphanomyces invadans]|uniref:Uncharacterized protein n=1 Tax=Aphanomyces invadans TaxID=157072 RepID=A0A3R6YUJ4_9STRA|nr:hypothetical protein DYB32_010290 [Aphanomyces invadans]